MPESLKKYKKQKNYWSRLYKKERKFFSNLDSSKMCVNKAFRKTIQPSFSKKQTITNKITLVDETVISEDQLISAELNQLFKNATKALNIQENSYLIDKSELSDPVDKAISKYKNHPSILLIKDKIINPAPFSFKEASLSDIEKELRKLNTKKASTFGNILPKILRASKEGCSESSAELFNNTLLTSSFPTELKVADVSPVFKKDDPLKTKNYRLISVLPVASKFFEIHLHKQMSLHVDRFLSPYLCSYQKGLSSRR